MLTAPPLSAPTLQSDRLTTIPQSGRPAAFLVKKAAGITKASKKGANEIVATITKEDVRKIAETKMPDLNAYTIEDAMKIIEGTARNMGIAVKGVNDAELQEQAKEAAIEEKEAEKREAELAEMEESVNNTNAEVEVINEKEDNKEWANDKELNILAKLTNDETQPNSIIQ